MEPYLNSFEHRLSVVRANSEIMMSFLDELDTVVDFVLDIESPQYLIVKNFVSSVISHSYHFDSMIDLLFESYFMAKGENNEA